MCFLKRSKGEIYRYLRCGSRENVALGFVAFGTMSYHYFFCLVDLPLSSIKAFLYDLAIPALSFWRQNLKTSRGVLDILAMDDSHEGIRNMSNPLSAKSKRMKGGRGGGFLESIRCFSVEQETDR